MEWDIWYDFFGIPQAGSIPKPKACYFLWFKARDDTLSLVGECHIRSPDQSFPDMRPGWTFPRPQTSPPTNLRSPCKICRWTTAGVWPAFLSCKLLWTASQHTAMRRTMSLSWRPPSGTQIQARDFELLIAMLSLQEQRHKRGQICLSLLPFVTCPAIIQAHSWTIS